MAWPVPLVMVVVAVNHGEQAAHCSHLLGGGLACVCGCAGPGVDSQGRPTGSAVEVLNLSGNTLGSAGATRLLQALASNPRSRVRVVHLGHTGISMRGLGSVLEAIAANPRLEAVSLDGLLLTDAGKKTCVVCGCARCSCILTRVCVCVRAPTHPPQPGLC